MVTSLVRNKKVRNTFVISQHPSRTAKWWHLPLRSEPEYAAMLKMWCAAVRTLCNKLEGCIIMITKCIMLLETYNT